MRLRPVFFALLVCTPVLQAAEIFVAPEGRDAADGSAAAPVATLQRARDLVREQRAAGAKEPATITVRAGTFELSAPLELGEKDSDLTIRAAEGAMPMLTASRVVPQWERHAGAIVKADVSGIVPLGFRVRQLLLDGRRQTLARYPNIDPANPLYGGFAWVGEPPAEAYAAHDWLRTFYVKPQDARKWAHPEDVELVIWKFHGWNNDRDRLKSFDPATRLITLDREEKNAREIMFPNRFFFQNALEELDAPGEWFHDVRTRTLYFWPPAPLAQKEVRVVTGESLLKVTKGAKRIVVRGLRFTGCEGVAINFDQVDECALERCAVDTTGQTGDYAVNINRGRDCRVSRCEITRTGGGGVRLFGGDWKTLAPAGHVVEDCHIHETGQALNFGSGIYLAGVGTSARHNHVHDVPRIGIELRGQKLAIEYNHIHQCMRETMDGAGIYSLGRDWLCSRGSRVAFNYVHDTIGVAQEKGDALKIGAYSWNIYMDDTTAGVDIIGNICARAGRAGLHMHNARDCVVENNIWISGREWQLDMQGWKLGERFSGPGFDGCVKGFESIRELPAWKELRGTEIDPRTSAGEGGLVMSGNVVRRNIVAWADPKVRYFWVSKVNASQNLVEQNLIWCGGPEPQDVTLKPAPGQTPWQTWLAAGWDRGSLLADPCFVDSAQDDYRLRPESPAWKLGWQAIPVEKIGPRPER